MSHSVREKVQSSRPESVAFWSASTKYSILALFLAVPLVAHAQGTPLDTGFTNLQNLFTGTVAKVGSLIAIVVGGYQFAHGSPEPNVPCLAWPRGPGLLYLQLTF